MNAFAARGVEASLGRHVRKPRPSKRPRHFVAGFIASFVGFVLFVRHCYHREEDGAPHRPSPVVDATPAPLTRRVRAAAQPSGSGWGCGLTAAVGATLVPSTSRRPPAARARAARRTAGAARARSSARLRSAARRARPRVPQSSAPGRVRTRCHTPPAPRLAELMLEGERGGAEEDRREGRPCGGRRVPRRHGRRRRRLPPRPRRQIRRRRGARRSPSNEAPST